MGTLRLVRSARNFDQLTRGQEILVDTGEQYWADNLLSGNVVLVADQQPALDFAAPEEVIDYYSDEDDE